MDVEDPEVYHKYSLIVRNNQADCSLLLNSGPIERAPAKWGYYDGRNIIILDKSAVNEPYTIYGIHGQVLEQGNVPSNVIPCKINQAGIYLLQVGDRNLKFVNP